jgi:hypothetical protein
MDVIVIGLHLSSQLTQNQDIIIPYPLKNLQQN